MCRTGPLAFPQGPSTASFIIGLAQTLPPLIASHWFHPNVTCFFMYQGKTGYKLFCYPNKTKYKTGIKYIFLAIGVLTLNEVL